MIPKTIHYCWFGGAPKPKSVLRCIASWKKHCPDYEIIEWNETNIDVSMNRYTQEAYDAKAWGFVPDYLRLWIVYTYGGIYLDTDVQVIKKFDKLLHHTAFAGFEAGDVENGLFVALGLGFGAEKGNCLIKEHMEIYDDISFINPDGTYNKLPSPHYTTALLIKYGLNRNSDTIQNLGGIVVYPTEWFCPKRLDTGITRTTKNTFSIHQFDASWFDDEGQKTKNDRWKRERIDYIKHIPNRMLMRWLGDQRYQKLKKLLKRGN